MNVTSLKQYRASQQEALRAELAQLRLALDLAEEAQRRLEEAALSNAKTYLAHAREGMRAEELAQWNDLMDRMTDSVHRASEAAAEARRLFQEKQRQAQDAARETRKLEVLEQRVAERERKVETMRNQRELDDIAGRRFQARRKEQDGPSSD